MPTDTPIELTDLSGDPYGADLEEVHTQQYLPQLEAGDFEIDSSSGLSSEDAAFAAAHKWYRRIVIPAEVRRPMTLELIGMSNALREQMRTHDAYAIVINRALHGIFGVGGTYSAANVPVWTAVNWPLVGVSSGGGLTTLTVRWDGEGFNDPRAVSSSSNPANPDWVPGDPDETHFPTVTSTFAAPPLNLVKFEAPSFLKFHGGLVLYAFEGAETVTEGGTFNLHCLGEVGETALDEFPDDSTSGEEIEVTYQFYRAHVAEVAAELRDCYPFYAKSEEVTVNAPAAGETLLLNKRVWPAGNWNSAVVSYDNGPDQTINPNVFLEITQPGGGAYNTYANFNLVSLAHVTRIVFTLWAESTDDDARLMGQNRCIHSREERSCSFGTMNSGGTCRHLCRERLSASGIAQFQVGDDVTGGCLLAGTCDKFAIDTDGPSNPLKNVKDLLSGHPWKYEQQTSGDPDSFVLTRIKRPSYGSECGMHVQLKQGLHLIVDFSLSTRGLSQRVIEDEALKWYRGFYYLQREDKPTPSMSDDATWPPYGPAGGLWEKAPDYPGAPDPGGVLASQVMVRDCSAHPYRIDQGFRGYLGEFQRWRAFSLLFDNIPDTDVTVKEYDDGAFARGSWDRGGRTFTMRFKLQPIRMARFQRAWEAAGRSAQIKSAEFLGDNKIALYLKNGIQTASTFFGDLDERVTRWHQGDLDVATPEFLQVRNFMSDCAVGMDGTKIREGMVGRIAGEGLEGLHIVEAVACYAGAGAQTDSYMEPPDDGQVEEDWYGEFVGIHGEYVFTGTEASGALPAGHFDRARCCARVVLYDEHGTWQAKGEEWFAGKTLATAHSAVLLSTADTTLTLRDSQEDWHWYLEAADGVLFTEEITAGNSLIIEGLIAARFLQPLQPEIVAPKILLQKALS